MARSHSSMRMGVLNLLVLVIALGLMVLCVLSLVTARADNTLSLRQVQSSQESYAQEMAGQDFLKAIDSRLASSRNAGTATDGLISALNLAAPMLAEDSAGYAMEHYADIEVSGVAETLTKQELMEQMKLISYTGQAQQSTQSALEDTSTEIIDDGPGGMIIEAPVTFDVSGSDGQGEASGADDAGVADVLQSDDGQQVEGVVVMEGHPGTLLSSDSSEEYFARLNNVVDGCVAGISANFSSPSGRNLNCLIGIRDDATYVVLKWQSVKSWYPDAQEEVLWMG